MPVLSFEIYGIVVGPATTLSLCRDSYPNEHSRRVANAVFTERFSK